VDSSSLVSLFAPLCFHPPLCGSADLRDLCVKKLVHAEAQRYAEIAEFGWLLTAKLACAAKPLCILLANPDLGVNPSTSLRTSLHGFLRLFSLVIPTAGARRDIQKLVEPRGVEPLTSSLPAKRSTS
jgi:hypothetical protein